MSEAYDPDDYTVFGDRKIKLQGVNLGSAGSERRHMEPQPGLDLDKITKCKLTCTDLMDPEMYGDKRLPEPNLIAIENRLEIRVMDAADSRDLNELLEARTVRDCFLKWRDQCMPDGARKKR